VTDDPPITSPERLDPRERRSVAGALATFATAAASFADASWELGWDAP
jgi:hypothetical protein